MGKMLRFVKRILHISSAHVKCDILSSNYGLGQEIDCKLILNNADWDEKFLSVELFLCVGKSHKFEIYGDTKIADSFILPKNEEKEVDFKVLLPYDDYLSEHKKDLFFIIDLHKNARVKKRISKEIQVR